MVKKLLAIKLRGIFMSAVRGKDKNGNAKPVSRLRYIGMGAVYLLIAATFLAMVSVFAAPLAMVAVPLGGENLYFGLFMLLSLSVIFIFSIFETKSELFECRDNDLLLSMPIRPRDIVISRVCTVLLYNYALEFILMVPVVVCYLIFGGGFVGALGSFYVFLTVPLIATSLSAGVGYAVHLLSLKFARFKNLMIMVLSLGFLILYFAAYTFIMDNMEKFLESIETNFAAIAEDYAFVAKVGSVSNFKLVPTLIYTAALIVITLTTVYVISKKYIGLMTKTVSAKKAVYVARELKGKSLLFAMTKKEFARFLSSPTYMLNGGLGLLFQLVGAVLIAVAGPGIFEIDPEMAASLGMSADEISKMALPLFISILAFTESMVMMSVSAVSLEGKSLWIIKSMPIDSKTLLLAKAMPQIILSTAVSLVSGIIASIGLGVGFTDALLFILIPTAFGIVVSLDGVVINVLLPKFDYANEVQVIKQSSATLVSMLVNMLIAGGMFALSLLAMSTSYVTLILLSILGALIAISAALYFITVGPIAKRFSTF